MEIRIQNIKKKYRGKEVLKDVSLEIKSGMCVGILGCNGSGKSTLLSILAGVQQSNSGRFFCNDIDMFENSKRRSEWIGYVPQGTPLIEELSAWDNLLLWYSKDEIKQELTGGVLQLLGVEEFLHKRVSKLSGGMKKRLSIGCSVAGHPPILLLDEPTAALDLSCKERIASYLMQYKCAGGTILLTTHDTMELSLCDAWYILKDGQLAPYHYDGNIPKLVESL